MIILNKKTLTSATIAATAVAGLGLATAPMASAAPTATKTVSKSFVQTCQTVGPLGSRKFPSKITVTQPTSVKHGTSFTVTTLLNITVPASVNSAAHSLGANSQRTTLKTINVNTTLLSKATTDITGAGSTTAPVAPVGTSATTLKFPKITTKFTAGSKAGSASVKTGSISGSFVLYASANGSGPGSTQQLSCAAQNVPVTSITIS